MRHYYELQDVYFELCNHILVYNVLHISSLIGNCVLSLVHCDCVNTLPDLSFTFPAIIYRSIKSPNQNFLLLNCSAWPA